MSATPHLLDEVRERAPMTVAAFMDLALYHPELGYYARAAQRSGRAGDFFTSVDVGPLFGDLLAVQIAEMACLIDASPSAPFDLVEAGAGNGRLSADILRALRVRAPSCEARTRLHLVEASPAARAAQAATLGEFATTLASSGPALPETFEGVLVANELFDAMPVHQVVVRNGALREVYVAVDGGALTTTEGPPSTPALAAYFDRAGVRLGEGWRAEVSLNAGAWIADAVRRLRRGFLILIDYGHEARDLYSDLRAGGTLMSFARHVSTGAEAAEPAWLLNPGEQDLTAHVDFTSLRQAAEAEGATTLGFLDQTYFLMALFEGGGPRTDPEAPAFSALKTLIMPGGLGSTMKVLILGKGVGTPTLMGCSRGTRVT